jgi:hypothetical protein
MRPCLAFALLLYACAGRSCAGCGDASLAVLVESKGSVERDYAASPGRFTSAAQAARFDSGDAVRTLVSAHARLQLPGASYVLVQADTTIRLWRGAKRALRLKVQTGDASVVAAQDPLEIETELGVAVLQAGSELRVRPARNGQRYEVSLGRAVLTGADGKQLTLEVGDGIGSEPEQPAAASAPAQPPVDAGAPNQAAALAALSIAHAPSDVVLALGSSIAIFDPKPPSAVTVDARGVCAGGAWLTVRGRAPLRVAERETLLLPVGAHDYKVACLATNGKPGPTELRGTLHVVRNPGTAQLPRSAPKNSIDSDGRTYTIMFQNLLPRLEVRWPHAPEASGYALSVELDSGRELQVALKTPVHVFAAGALPEGRHKLHFTAERPGAPRSKQTTIDLRFDNASPSASLRAPPLAGFEPGPTVHVAGIALPGSQVSVLGQRLALDGQQRFAGDVPVPVGTRSIAVRIQHPRSGTRYYIRRARP